MEGDALRLERLWLGLRTRDGVEVGSLGPAGLRQVEAWARRGLAEVEEEAVRLTAEGWLLLDRLTVELEEALEG